MNGLYVFLFVVLISHQGSANTGTQELVERIDGPEKKMLGEWEIVSELMGGIVDFSENSSLSFSENQLIEMSDEERQTLEIMVESIDPKHCIVRFSLFFPEDKAANIKRKQFAKAAMIIARDNAILKMNLGPNEVTNFSYQGQEVMTARILTLKRKVK